ncbi:MAG TPA: hypothetical protein EYN66_01685 [Myxococcales bacterium]|nr:hypothetical protein [Myxococcales bacterium]
MRRLYRAMEWEETPEYLFYFLSENARLQRNVGVFLKNGDAGFNGTSFQSALSWESYFGMCRDRSTDPTCPLQLILDSPVDQGVEATICEICTNKDLACNWDARCCDISWESYCSTECDTGDPDAVDLAIFPQVLRQEGPDFITQVVELAQSDKEYTLRHALAALKDRLINVPHIDAGEESQWLEALFETSLETVAADDAALEEHLRRACGVFATSPQFLLTGFPGQDIAKGHGGLIPPGQSFRELCEQTALTLFGDEIVQCGDHALKIVAP